MNRIRTASVVGVSWVLLFVPPAHAGKPPPPAAEQLLEAVNPLVPLPKPPLGITSSFEELEDPPTPERVRLGRWLFYDKRLSRDGTVSCATCHRPENAFSEPTPVSTGIAGQKGRRKAPSFLNLAWTLNSNFFWDGRASSLEEQALGPIANPIEMGNTHEAVVAAIRGIQGYRTYFQRAFGSEEVTLDRIAKAIADYERTRMSGNSAWDRWRAGDENAVSPAAKKGHELFFGKAGCNRCHLGERFTDDVFHNLGIGWNPESRTFSDEGRGSVSKNGAHPGGFKTPALRDVSKHAPYMHDGSLATLRQVVEHYDKGGNPNPKLDPKLSPLKLSSGEIDALVELMKALDGEGYADAAPRRFPE